MQVIPVLDLLDNMVVQGLRGERDSYQPIQSILLPAGSATPVQVATALQTHTGCHALYVADLNAIQRTGNNHATLNALTKRIPAEIWLDAGINTPTAVQASVAAGIDRVIIGSETLASLAELDAVQAAIAPHQLIFSLDTHGGKILSQSSELRNLAPLAALHLLLAKGWSQFILLTLDRVGTGSGLDWQLLAQARTTFPAVSLIAGGGIRQPAELERLADIGMDGVLIATALHRGWIERDTLQQFTSAQADREKSRDRHPRSETRKASQQ